MSAAIEVTRGIPSRIWSSRVRDPLLLYVPFAVFVILTFCVTTDDPFITLRYAANVVHGHGAVFNIGQTPVEGFSSPLDLIVVIVAYLIPGGASLLMIKLASLLFGFLTLGAARKLIRRTELPPWGMSLAFFLTGASWTLAIASSNGLETTLSAWLTTMLVARLVTGDAVSHPVATGVIAAGVVLVRPEGVGIVAVLALACLVMKAGHAKARRRVAWALGGLMAVVTATVTRLVYYGEPLPNTYYAKRISQGSGVHSGLTYFGKVLLLNFESFDPHGAYVVDIKILGIVCSIVLAVGWIVTVRKMSPPSFVAVAVAAQVAFILLVGGDWMSGGRFLAPVAPLVALLDAIGVVALAQRVRRWRSEKSNAPTVVRGVLIALLSFAAVVPILPLRDPVWNSHWKFDTASLFAASNGGGFHIGVWLAGAEVLQCAQPGDVVTYSEVGYAGFTHLDVRFIDIRGLTDRAIARNAPASDRNLYGVTDPSWESPTSVVGREILAQHSDFVLTFDRTIRQRKVLGGHYAEVGSKVIQPGNTRLTLYARIGQSCAAPGFVPPNP